MKAQGLVEYLVIHPFVFFIGLFLTIMRFGNVGEKASIDQIGSYLRSDKIKYNY